MEKLLTLPELLPSFNEGLGKKQINKLANRSVDSLLEEGNVFQVAEAIAAMEEFVKAVRRDSRFVDFIREELTKHNGRLETTSGARLELCEAAVCYDYSQDGTWRMLEENIQQLQEQKKQREEELRMIGIGKIAVDPDTGEVLEGPAKSSKSTYRITLAR
ncbi:MAG TPA: hypothetical protein VEZ55_07300 [Chitinophagaceae bacterium]|nr:hypothetical protein [Chitinophagaceae bacterium]